MVGQGKEGEGVDAKKYKNKRESTEAATTEGTTYCYTEADALLRFAIAIYYYSPRSSILERVNQLGAT